MTLVGTLLLFLLSPTRVAFSSIRKRISNQDTRRRFVRLWVSLFPVVAASVFALLALLSLKHGLGNPTLCPTLLAIVWVLPLSRTVELVYAFSRDVLFPTPERSTLPSNERSLLAMVGYLEVLVHFALVYYVLPIAWIDADHWSGWEALYFSGVTITTLGYGDVLPIHDVAKMIVILEPLVGFVLLILALGSYTSE